MKRSKLYLTKKRSISLWTLHNAVKIVATERGQKYFTVKANIEHDGQLILGGYIHGATHVEGATIDEVCQKLRQFNDWRVSDPINSTEDVFL